MSAPCSEETSVSIKLTERRIFLPVGSNQPPAVLRALLVLDVHKPIRVSSIEVELEGKCKNIFSEGWLKEHELVSFKSILFNASKESHLMQRRCSSASPSVNQRKISNLEEEDHPSTDDEAQSDSDDARSLPTFSATPAIMHSTEHQLQGSISTESVTAHHIGTSELPITAPEGLNVLFSPCSTLLESPVSSPTITLVEHPTTTSSAESRFYHKREPETPQPSSPMNVTHHLAEPPINNTSSDAQIASLSAEGLYLRRSSSAEWTSSMAPCNFDSQFQSSPSFQCTCTEPRELQDPIQVNSEHVQPMARRDRHRLSLPHIPKIHIVWKESRNPCDIRSTYPVSSVIMSDMTESVRGDSRRDGHPRSLDDDGSDDERGRSQAKKSIFERASEVLHSVVKPPPYRSNAGELEGGDSWVEMRKGTYTYPILFLLPASLRLPPSMDLPNGGVTYRLKASVHRPGALVKKLHTVKEVKLISCPVEVNGEQEDNVVIERQWGSQLRFQIELAKRVIQVGGEVGIRFTFIPLDKVKIWRIKVLLEEQVVYLAKNRRYTETPNLFELWNVESQKLYPNSPLRNQRCDRLPLLPVSSDIPEAALESPLLPFLVTSEANDGIQLDGADATSELFGPGPYTIAKTVRIPGADRLHPGYLQRDSGERSTTCGGDGKYGIEVKHTMIIIMRVERGDDKYLNEHGKKGRWDIVVQIGVRVLPCRSASYTSLPLYSMIAPDASIN